MVWDQGPGVALGLCFFEDDCKPFEKRVAVLVISEKSPAFNSPGHKRVGGDRGRLIWVGRAWLSIKNIGRQIKFLYQVFKCI